MSTPHNDHRGDKRVSPPLILSRARKPRGREGRQSKSKCRTLDQARAVFETRDDPLHAYIVVSLLTGARTEELRALRWEHVHLDGTIRSGVRSLPYVEVW